MIEVKEYTLDPKEVLQLIKNGVDLNDFEMILFFPI